MEKRRDKRRADLASCFACLFSLRSIGRCPPHNPPKKRKAKKPNQLSHCAAALYWRVSCWLVLLFSLSLRSSAAAAALNPPKKRTTQSTLTLHMPLGAAKPFHSLFFFISPIRKSENEKKKRNELGSGIQIEWFQQIQEKKLFLSLFHHPIFIHTVIILFNSFHFNSTSEFHGINQKEKFIFLCWLMEWKKEVELLTARSIEILWIS